MGVEYYPPPKVYTPAQLAKMKASKAKAQAKVVKYEMQQATNGDAAFQTSLGIRYLEGNGVDKDFQQATNWLAKAAANGDLEASNKLVSLTMTNKPDADQ